MADPHQLPSITSEKLACFSRLARLGGRHFQREIRPYLFFQMEKEGKEGKPAARQALALGCV